MNSEQLEKIKQTACNYVTIETKFANTTFVSVEEINDYDEQHGQCFSVRLALSHTATEIERLVSEGNPDEADVKREFLEGDFLLNLVIAGGVVVASEWENMDLR